MSVEHSDATQCREAILEGLARGEQAIEEGRTLTQAEAKNKMAKWLNNNHTASG